MGVSAGRLRVGHILVRPLLWVSAPHLSARPPRRGGQGLWRAARGRRSTGALAAALAVVAVSLFGVAPAAHAAPAWWQPPAPPAAGRLPTFTEGPPTAGYPAPPPTPAPPAPAGGSAASPAPPAPAPGPPPAPPDGGASPSSGPPGGFGCGAAVAYLEANAAPGFDFECPGDSLGRQAMTCIDVPGICPGARVIAITVPCGAAYMNEASNSWVLEGLSDAPIDPYGDCQ